ncbi:MAG TPA: WecB/TagA/CpsF family glycosyltransferase [Chloroflexota bacterium]|nr:WecB/TagA/CpsF family glycosyltransferase [Chloroflexota bacterium]
MDLGGVLIDQIDLAGAVERIHHFARSGQPHQVVTVNLDFLSIAERDPEFRTTLNVADLAVADGMPLVWLSRMRGQPVPERVAGVELVTESCRLAAELGQGVFLLGAAPGVADAAGCKLQALYPDLRIAGAYSPPIGPLSRRENQRIVDMVRLSKAAFLFVALGAPRQDLWIREHQPQLQMPVAMGVGCVLDLLAGATSRAPRWMQRAGLEWAYRLSREPQRLWRRYLVNDLPMLARLVFAEPKHEPVEPTEALAVSS